jgi:hypothetical protein
MTDDSADVVAVATFRDPDSGALALSPSPDPLPSPSDPPPPPATEPVSEVAQLFNLIMDTIRPMQAEIKRIGDKVDGKPAPVPAQQTKARAALKPSAPKSTSPSLTTPTQRVDDEPQADSTPLDSDPAFPPPCTIG